MNTRSIGRKLLIGVILAAADLFLLILIFRFSFLARTLLAPFFKREASWASTEPLMQLGIIAVIAVFFIQDLYPGYGLTAVRELERMGKSITLAFFLLAGASYLVKPLQDLSRSILIFSWGISLIVLPVGHFLVRNFLSRFEWYGVQVVVFGSGAWAGKITASLQKIRRLGWHSAVLLPMEALTDQKKQPPHGEVAIFALPPDAPVGKYARRLGKHFRKVILFRQSENLGSLWIEPRDLEGQLGLEFHYHLFEGIARWLKRAIDFLGSLTLLIVLVPFWVVLIPLIYIDSPGPVFFYQERLGENFKRFRVIKFRTMVLNAEQKLHDVLAADPAARAEYETYHKLTNDPRITRVGRWLRRFSFDELPQLWNALIGEMSLIGPRAYMPSELKSMGDYAPTILRVKPGLTGWWQVAGRHNMPFIERLRMDEYYISNWSLWMDAYILLKTFWVVMSARGA